MRSRGRGAPGVCASAAASPQPRSGVRGGPVRLREGHGPGGRLTGWMGALKPTTRRIGRTPAPHTCPRYPAHQAFAGRTRAPQQRPRRAALSSIWASCGWIRQHARWNNERRHGQNESGTRVQEMHTTGSWQGRGTVGVATGEGSSHLGSKAADHLGRLLAPLVLVEAQSHGLHAPLESDKDATGNPAKSGNLG